MSGPLRSGTAPLAGLMVLLAVWPGRTEAQQQAAEAPCPVQGVALTVDGTVPRIAPGSRTSRDTTLYISVDRRQWSKQDVTASVAAGLAGTENARWRACAGASVEMRRADMVIEGASGTVHLRTSLETLLQRLRARRLQPAENLRRNDT